MSWTPAWPFTEELGLMILVDPFQFRIFCDLWFREHIWSYKVWTCRWIWPRFSSSLIKETPKQSLKKMRNSNRILFALERIWTLTFWQHRSLLQGHQNKEPAVAQGMKCSVRLKTRATKQLALCWIAVKVANHILKVQFYMPEIHTHTHSHTYAHFWDIQEMCCSV